MSRRGPVVLGLALALGVPATAQGYVVQGRAWPGRPATITYANATPYKAEVRAAAAAWNASGARVRFVATSSRRAAVHIRTDGVGAVGYASIGKQPGASVTLGRGGRGSVEVAVIAHELGHVIGLGHDTKHCSTMSPIVWTGCSTPPPCTVLQADDVRGAIKRYGGRARSRPPVFCPAPPSPPVVTQVPDAYAMRATFRMPRSSYATGYRSAVVKGSCPSKPPVDAGGDLAKPGAQVTADVTPGGDPFAGGAGSYCLALWTTGDFDRVGRVAVTKRFTWSPPPVAAPARLTATQEAAGVRLAWPAVAHRDVSGYRISARPGDTCDTSPTAPSDASQTFQAGREQTSVLVPVDGRGRFCFAIWSEDDRGHSSAAPATVVLDVAGSRPPFASFNATTDGASVAFEDFSVDEDGRIVAWRWTFGDGTSSAERDPVHAYAVGGEHEVTLTVTDDDGLTGEITSTVSSG